MALAGSIGVVSFLTEREAEILSGGNSSAAPWGRSSSRARRVARRADPHTALAPGIA